MAEIKAIKHNGPLVNPGLCRCCRSIKKCRILTAEYEFMDTKEVYSDMFMDVFGLLLSHLDSDSNDLCICATCVSRLREACAFRRQVLQSEQMFLKARLQNKDGNEHIVESEIKIEPVCELDMPNVTMDDTFEDYYGHKQLVKSEIKIEPVFESDIPDVTMDDSSDDQLGLTEDEIRFALSDSEIDEIDEEAGGLYEDGDFIHSVNREDVSSTDSDDAVPLSKLVSGPVCGRSIIRRGGSSHRPHSRGGRFLRGKLARGRGGSRSPIRIVQDAGDDDSDSSDSDMRREWIESEFIPSVIPYVQPAYVEVASSEFDKFNYFKQYIDEELVQLIVLRSNQTYIKNTGKSLGLTQSEFYIYLGITIVMSTINYPQLRMYWEKKFHVPVIANNMSRNRFFVLRNSIKFVFDDDIGRDVRDSDKMWKIRPLLDSMLRACRLQPKEESMCIDKIIVPFTGQCLLKQYVPNKQNPSGIKIYVLATPNGIVVDFDVYQGKTTYPTYEESHFGVGEKAVLRLTENLVAGHKLYFDRYFTSEKLVLELKDRNLLCAGTVMKNRIPVAARPYLKDDREMKSEGRGASQMLVNYKNNVVLTKWLDNKGIIMLSTAHGTEPVETCSRWSKTSRQYVNIPRPNVMKAYNENMAGVKLADRMLSVSPNRYRTKKWTQRMFSHMIDLACSNGWLLYKKDRLKEQVPINKIQQLRSFKLELGETLLDAYAGILKEEETGNEEHENERNKGRGRPPQVVTPSERSRKRGANHMPQITDSQKRCRNCHKMKTTVQCVHCNVHLCFRKDRNCFLEFHF